VKRRSYGSQRVITSGVDTGLLQNPVPGYVFKTVVAGARWPTRRDPLGGSRRAPALHRAVRS